MALTTAAPPTGRRIVGGGAGVSGLTAAHLLSRSHRVTLFEADGRLGGHAHTHCAPTRVGRELRIESGFIVHNERTYPHRARCRRIRSRKAAIRTAASPPKECEMTATRSDRVRQFAVTVSGITCVVGTLVGIGVLGTRVEDSARGSLSADATLLAPASTAFTIWSVIYAGLAAFTVWQWLPRAATSRRIRSVGWLAAASMLLNAGWLLVVQQGWLWASVGVIVALLAVLAVLVTRLSAEPAGSTMEKVVVDGTFGLYLGWVCVATAANIAATIAAEGIAPVRAVSEGIAALVLLVVGAVGVMLAVTLGGRIAVTSAIVWGLAWIAVGRTSASPDSTVTAITAGAIAVLIVAATAAARLRGGPLPDAGEDSLPGPRSWVRRRRA